jgi:hypothetical protein
MNNNSAEKKYKIIKNLINKLLASPLGLAFSTLLLMLGGGWFSDALKGSCNTFIIFQCEIIPDKTQIFCSGLFGLLIFSMGAHFVYKGTRGFMAVRHLKCVKPTPRKAMIYSISDLYGYKLDTQEGSAIVFNESDDSSFKFSGSIEDDIKSEFLKKINLMQYIRAIHPHINRLERIQFIVSKKSEALADDYFNIIKMYQPKIEQISSPVVLDFESVEQLYGANSEAVLAIKKLGIDESEIIIEATGGQKTTSIAAALATLHHDGVEFQYVSTQKPNEVKTFNVVTEMPAKYGA